MRISLLLLDNLIQKTYLKQATRQQAEVFNVYDAEMKKCLIESLNKE